MSVFRRKLAEQRADPRGRRWLFIPYDQLTDSIGPLAREDPKTLGIVLVENPWKAARRPYHTQKLALIPGKSPELRPGGGGPERCCAAPGSTRCVPEGTGVPRFGVGNNQNDGAGGTGTACRSADPR